MNVGSRVRDYMDCRLDPTPLLRRAVTDFVKWAYADAGIPGHGTCVPVSDILFIDTVRPGEPPALAMARVEARVHDAADRFRDAWGFKRGGGLKMRVKKVGWPVPRMTPEARRRGLYGGGEGVRDLLDGAKRGQRKRLLSPTQGQSLKFGAVADPRNANR